MTLVKVLVVQLDQFDALVLFQGRKFFELLSENVEAKFHGSFLVEVVKAFELFFATLSFVRKVVHVSDLLGHEAAHGRLGVSVGVIRLVEVVVFITIFGLLILRNLFAFFHICSLHELVDCSFVKDTRSWTQK